ncbi:MAG TPA: hypothetical protein VMB05_16270 [Solirubrobacteraceae bacterium]|nr:hypothetical protein [Solirubrobacteraceae bacterium]
MDNSAEQPEQQRSDASAQRPRVVRLGAPPTRLPSRRMSIVLAVAMLTIGVVVGAAIGPAPATSLAGDGNIAQKLPALIAAVAGRSDSATAPQPVTTSTQPPPIEPQATPAASPTRAASTTTSPPAQEATQPSQSQKKSSPAPSKSGGGKPADLPPITSVWLIELNGSSFSEAIANPTAAPYIASELIPKGTFLSSWSALSASAFAGEAALVEHRATVGGTPPVLHTILQPPCPEGPTSTTCLPGTPPGIGLADAFLKATVASITASTTFTEHGLIVVTYATVADPATAELPAGSASATLATQPPAGVVLLSPFAKAGAKSSIGFNPSSPVQSLEKLLH